MFAPAIESYFSVNHGTFMTAHKSTGSPANQSISQASVQSKANPVKHQTSQVTSELLVSTPARGLPVCYHVCMRICTCTYIYIGICNYMEIIGSQVLVDRKDARGSLEDLTRLNTSHTIIGK